MTHFIINPGSGPIRERTRRLDAERSIRAFCRELSERLAGCRVSFELDGTQADGGRYPFTVHADGRPSSDVCMPGLPATKLKLGPIASPRLYVDGSSWLWEFALGVCCRGDDE